MHVEFETRKGRTGSFNRIEAVDGVERFSADYQSGYSPRRDYSTHVEIGGQAQRQADGTIQVDLDVDADEPISFAVEGFEVVKMMHGDVPIDKTDSLAGKFHIMVVGHQ